MFKSITQFDRIAGGSARSQARLSFRHPQRPVATRRCPRRSTGGSRRTGTRGRRGCGRSTAAGTGRRHKERSSARAQCVSAGPRCRTSSGTAIQFRYGTTLPTPTLHQRLRVSHSRCRCPPRGVCPSSGAIPKMIGTQKPRRAFSRPYTSSSVTRWQQPGGLQVAAGADASQSRRC